MKYTMRARKGFIMWLLALMVSGCAVVSAQPKPTVALSGELPTELLTQYEAIDSRGEAIGPVDGLIVNVQTGETLYAVILLEDIYNFGKGAVNGPQDKYLLIPWSRVCMQEHKQLKVELTAGELAEAPTFYRLPDTTDPAWDVVVRQFWADH
jgi:sporulation protein YlmC with PRC-barrel domain